jgi:hypothetical protein
MIQIFKNYNRPSNDENDHDKKENPESRKENSESCNEEVQNKSIVLKLMNRKIYRNITVWSLIDPFFHCFDYGTDIQYMTNTLIVYDAFKIILICSILLPVLIQISRAIMQVLHDKKESAKIRIANIFNLGEVYQLWKSEELKEEEK